MAQIPNYYYNSPWIADAARSFASALAPPDPDKTMARQRAQWEFDRMQELAQIQDEDRAVDREADLGLVDLYQDEPIIDPVTQKVDMAATMARKRTKAAQVLKGGREYIEPVESVLGPYSPQFESQQILAAVKAAVTEQQMNARFGNQIELAKYNQGQQTARQEALLSHRWSIEAFRQSGQFQRQMARAQNRMTEIEARIKAGGGGGKMNIAGKPLEDLVTFLEMKIQNSGATDMAQPYRDELLTQAAIIANRTGNIPVAIDEVWSAAGLPDSAPGIEQPGIVMQFLQGVGLADKPVVLTPKFGQRPEQPAAGGDASASVSARTFGSATTPQVDPNYLAGLEETMRTGRPPEVQTPAYGEPPVDQGPPAPDRNKKTTTPKTPAKSPTKTTSSTPPVQLLKRGKAGRFTNPTTGLDEWWTLGPDGKAMKVDKPPGAQ